MHRSGTSSLAGILKNAGVNFYESNEYNRFNRRGNQEAQVLVDVNNKILLSAGKDWLTASYKCEYQVTEEDLNVYLKYLEIAFNNQGDGTCVGFKDPRFTIISDKIIKKLENENYNFINVGTYRHPFEVASSISSREKNIELEEGYYAWINYNEKLLKDVSESKSPLVYFSNLPSIYKIEVQILLHDIKEILNINLSVDKGLNFFHTDLIHQSDEDHKGIPKACENLLNELNTYRFDWINTKL